MKKKINRVYSDTSVIGGIVDSEFSEHSKQFIKYAKSGLFTLVVSPVIDDEIYSEGTPPQVIREYEGLLDFCEIAKVNEESLEL